MIVAICVIVVMSSSGHDMSTAYLVVASNKIHGPNDMCIGGWRAQLHVNSKSCHLMQFEPLKPQVLGPENILFCSELEYVCGCPIKMPI